jgi:hypothetical protein
LPPPSCPSKEEHLFQVLAIHDRSDDQEGASYQHTDRGPAPGIPAHQGGSHAKRAYRDKRLASLVGHRARTASTLPEWGDTAGLPGVEKYRESYQRYQDPEQYRELFQPHASLECKKGARIGGGRAPCQPAAVILKR